jgi:hypothetical protein
LRRRTARSTTYVAVFHGWRGECRIDRVEPCADAVPDDALAFWVHLMDGERHVVTLSELNLPGEAGADRVFRYVRSPLRAEESRS